MALGRDLFLSLVVLTAAVAAGVCYGPLCALLVAVAVLTYAAGEQQTSRRSKPDLPPAADPEPVLKEFPSDAEMPVPVLEPVPVCVPAPVAPVPEATDQESDGDAGKEELIIALEEAHRKLKVFDSIKVFMCQTDRLGNVTEWNAHAETLTGYEAECRLGRPLLKFLQARSLSDARPLTADSETQVSDGVTAERDGRGVLLAETFEKAFSGEEVSSHLHIRNRMQKRVDLSATWMPLRDTAGGITGIALIAYDNTSLTAMHEKLLETRRYADSLIGMVPVPLAVVTRHGLVVRSSNEAFNSKYFSATSMGRSASLQNIPSDNMVDDSEMELPQSLDDRGSSVVSDDRPNSQSPDRLAGVLTPIAESDREYSAPGSGRASRSAAGVPLDARQGSATHIAVSRPKDLRLSRTWNCDLNSSSISWGGSSTPDGISPRSIPPKPENEEREKSDREEKPGSDMEVTKSEREETDHDERDDGEPEPDTEEELKVELKVDEGRQRSDDLPPYPRKDSPCSPKMRLSASPVSAQRLTRQRRRAPSPGSDSASPAPTFATTVSRCASESSPVRHDSRSPRSTRSPPKSLASTQEKVIRRRSSIERTNYHTSAASHGRLHQPTVSLAAAPTWARQSDPQPVRSGGTHRNRTLVSRQSAPAALIDLNHPLIATHPLSQRRRYSSSQAEYIAIEPLGGRLAPPSEADELAAGTPGSHLRRNPRRGRDPDPDEVPTALLAAMTAPAPAPSSSPSSPPRDLLRFPSAMLRESSETATSGSRETADVHGESGETQYQSLSGTGSSTGQGLPPLVPHDTRSPRVVRAEFTPPPLCVSPLSYSGEVPPAGPMTAPALGARVKRPPTPNHMGDEVAGTERVQSPKLRLLPMDTRSPRLPGTIAIPLSERPQSPHSMLRRIPDPSPKTGSAPVHPALMPSRFVHRRRHSVAATDGAVTRILPSAQSDLLDNGFPGFHSPTIHDFAIRAAFADNLQLLAEKAIPSALASFKLPSTRPPLQAFRSKSFNYDARSGDFPHFLTKYTLAGNPPSNDSSSNNLNDTALSLDRQPHRFELKGKSRSLFNTASAREAPRSRPRSGSVGSQSVPPLLPVRRSSTDNCRAPSLFPENRQLNFSIAKVIKMSKLPGSRPSSAASTNEPEFPPSPPQPPQRPHRSNSLPPPPDVERTRTRTVSAPNQSQAKKSAETKVPTIGDSLYTLFDVGDSSQRQFEELEEALSKMSWQGSESVAREMTLGGRTVELVARPLPHPDDGAGGHGTHGRLALICLFDLTTQRQNMEVLLKLKKAEGISEAKTEFVARLSHELRNPLNGVLGAVQGLEMGNLTEEQAECVKTVRKASDLLMTIINDILYFSKVETNKISLDIEDFDLRQVVEGAVEIMSRMGKGKGLQLTSFVSPGMWTALRGAPTRISQLIINLLSNGIKFTERGSVAVRASAKAETESTLSFVVECEDTGIGISPEHLDKLCTPFFQVDPCSPNGTGLGLAISQRFLRLMGGHYIGVTSLPGKGSTFWFELELPKAAGPITGTKALSQSMSSDVASPMSHPDATPLLLSADTENADPTILSASSIANLVSHSSSSGRSIARNLSTSTSGVGLDNGGEPGRCIEPAVAADMAKLRDCYVLIAVSCTHTAQTVSDYVVAAGGIPALFSNGTQAADYISGRISPSRRRGELFEDCSSDESDDSECPMAEIRAPLLGRDGIRLAFMQTDLPEAGLLLRALASPEARRGRSFTPVIFLQENAPLPETVHGINPAFLPMPFKMNRLYKIAGRAMAGVRAPSARSPGPPGAPAGLDYLPLPPGTTLPPTLPPTQLASHSPSLSSSTSPIPTSHSAQSLRQVPSPEPEGAIVAPVLEQSEVGPSSVEQLVLARRGLFRQGNEPTTHNQPLVTVCSDSSLPGTRHIADTPALRASSCPVLGGPGTSLNATQSSTTVSSTSLDGFSHTAPPADSNHTAQLLQQLSSIPPHAMASITVPTSPILSVSPPSRAVLMSPPAVAALLRSPGDTMRSPAEHSPGLGITMSIPSPQTSPSTPRTPTAPDPEVQAIYNLDFFDAPLYKPVKMCNQPAELPRYRRLPEPWAPSVDAHFLYPPSVRAEVCSVLSVALRPGSPMARLPHELVCLICAFATAPIDDMPSKPLVLFVDDSAMNLSVGSVLIRRMPGNPCNLCFADDGIVAVATYDAYRVGLIFMDISMPIMSGTAATSMIRAMERERGWPPVPIIAATGEPLEAEQWQASGYSDYAIKPHKKEVFYDLINKHLLQRIATPQD